MIIYDPKPAPKWSLKDEMGNLGLHPMEAYLSLYYCLSTVPHSGQISIIPKPELRLFWEDSPTQPPFKVTSAVWSL